MFLSNETLKVIKVIEKKYEFPIETYFETNIFISYYTITGYLKVKPTPHKTGSVHFSFSVLKFKIF
jgi:hypothetical protein